MNHVSIQPGIVDDIIEPYGKDATDSTVSVEYRGSAPSTTVPPPPVPPRNNRSEHIEDVNYPNHGPSSGPISMNDADNQNESLTGTFNVYDDIARYPLETTLPPILMPVRNGVYESYLNSLLAMLHEIPAVRAAVFKHEFPTLGMHPRWFKGEVVPLSTEVSTVEKDGEKHDLRFLLEVQRLFAFLEGESSRAFASANGFLKSFPKKAAQKFAEVESISEAYDAFVKTLSDELAIADVPNAGDIFRSLVTGDPDEPEPRQFGMLPIEAEDFRSTIYESLSSILWGQQEGSPIISFAGILAISIEPPHDRNIELPKFSLHEKIYPQIFTRDFNWLLQSLKKDNNDRMTEMEKLTREIKNLTHFKNMRVSKAIDTSVEFFEKKLESNDNPKIKEITEMLAKVRDETNVKVEAMKERKRELLDLINLPTDFSGILEKYGSSFEPYMLTGVILSSRNFAFLRRMEHGLQWFSVDYNMDRGGSDYNIYPITFNDLKIQTKLANVREMDTGFVLLYVKESVFMEQEADQDLIPSSVKLFIEKDTTELLNSLEMLDSSDDEVRPVTTNSSDEDNEDNDVDVLKEVDDQTHAHERVEDISSGESSDSADMIELDSSLEESTNMADADADKETSDEQGKVVIDEKDVSTTTDDNAARST